MLPEPIPPGSPRAWLHYARSDLRLARARPDRVMLEALCFHAQQVAEKALKAVLVAHRVQVPRTHTTGALLSLMPARLDLPENVMEAAVLTDHAVASRCPGDLEPVEEDECREAVRLAETVISWAAGTVAAAAADGQGHWLSCKASTN